VLARDREPSGRPPPSDGLDQNRRRRTQAVQAGTGKGKSAALASRDANATARATIAVDDHAIGLPLKGSVRAREHTGGAADASRASFRSPDGDGMPCASRATEQGAAGQSTKRHARPFMHGRFKISFGHTRHRGSEKGD
jgi:hypothetical protein